MHGPPGVLAAKGRPPVFVNTKDVEDGPLCAAQTGVPEIEYRATRRAQCHADAACPSY